MERKAFQTWLSAIDTLSAAQKAEVGEVLAGRPIGEASLAAVELSVGEDRSCPHCGTPGAVANGKARGMQRYLCRSCKRTFGAVTGTPLSGLHHKDVWLTFGECLKAAGHCRSRRDLRSGEPQGRSFLVAGQGRQALGGTAGSQSSQTWWQGDQARPVQ